MRIFIETCVLYISDLTSDNQFNDSNITSLKKIMYMWCLLFNKILNFLIYDQTEMISFQISRINENK